MGGLLLTAASSGRMPTANPDPDFKEILPGSPTALREFPSGDQLTLAVDVYDNKVSTPHRVEIRTSVTADNGNVVFSCDRRAPHRGAERRQRHVRSRRHRAAQGRRARALRPACRGEVTAVERRHRRARGRDHRTLMGDVENHRARRRQPARRASPLSHPRSPGVQRRLGGPRRARMPLRRRSRLRIADGGGRLCRRASHARLRHRGDRHAARGLVPDVARRARRRTTPRSHAAWPRRSSSRPSTSSRSRATTEKSAFNVPDSGGLQTIVFKPPPRTQPAGTPDTGRGSCAQVTPRSRRAPARAPSDSHRCRSAEKRLVVHRVDAACRREPGLSCRSVFGGAAPRDREGERVRPLPRLAGRRRSRPARDRGGVFLGLAFVLLIVSPTAFWAMLWLAAATGAAWVGVWALCVFNAYKGRVLKLPLAGAYAERHGLNAGHRPRRKPLAKIAKLRRPRSQASYAFVATPRGLRELRDDVVPTNPLAARSAVTCAA